MFAIRSWTEAGHAQPLRAVCDACREDFMGDSEAARWSWVQHHTCAMPPKVLYLDAKRKAANA